MRVDELTTELDYLAPVVCAVQTREALAENEALAPLAELRAKKLRVIADAAEQQSLGLKNARAMLEQQLATLEG